MGEVGEASPGGRRGRELLRRRAPLCLCLAAGVLACAAILRAETAPGDAGARPACPDPSACFLQGIAAFREARYPDAIAALGGALREPLGGQEFAAYYLLLSHWKAGHVAEAMGFCREFLELYPEGPLAPHVERLEAEGYVRSDAPWLAAQAYQKLIQRGDSPDLRLAYGHVLESLGRLTDAHESHRTLRMKWPESAEARAARKRMRQLEERLPRLGSWSQETRGLRDEETLAMKEKNWQDAISLQQKLLDRPLSSSLRRRVLWDRIQALVAGGKLDAAREETRSLLLQAPRSREAAMALYAVGRGFWRKDRNGEAQGLLERLVDDYTDDEEAAQASYILGRIHLEGGDPAQAIRWFRYTRFLYPWTEWEREAAWWEAWSLYRVGDYPACAALLEGLDAGGVWVPDLIPRSRYWQARCLERAGDGRRGRQLYQELSAGFPSTYYGLQARARLGAGDAPPPCRQAAAAAAHGKDAAAGLYGAALMLQDPVLPLLLEAGLRLDAVQRMDRLRRTAAGRALLGPEDWIEAYAQAGDLARALQAAYRGGLAERILAEGTSGQDERSVRLLRALYPLYYADLIQARADAAGLDPCLVAGLIRQESLFQPDAHSPAGAVGLMQIMPATGRRLAAKLGMKNFRRADLLDPEINIRLGTAYLAELKERYGPDWQKILANYNAGPRPVEKWAGDMPTAAPDEFVENILYRETRLYVKRVLLNRDIYRTLYGEEGP